MPNADEEDFERFLRHDLGIRQLASVVALSGKLVTPEEARALYEREHQDLSAQAVFFSAANFFDQVTVTPEAVGQFYTNQMAAYRVPERVQVSYVKFEATNYWEEASEELAKNPDLSAEIDRVYEQRGTNFYADAKSPEEAKERIREEGVRELALRQARRVATTFASTLFDLEQRTPEAMQKLAEEKNLPVGVTAPFPRDEDPQELGQPPGFAKAAFALNPDEPFGGPIVGPDGVYVITTHKRIPSEVPPLEQIKERVTADYQYSQAAQLARQAGAEFSTRVRAAIAEGKSFAALAVEANVKPEALPPFSISTQSLPEVEQRMSLFQFKQIAFSTKPGEVSDFIPTRDGGVTVYVQEKLPIDETRMQAELPEFLQRVRQARQNEAFNDWFRREAEQGLRDTPLARPPPQMTGSAR
jgi:peptidyl-prolyl cis-trans isomerase D